MILPWNELVEIMSYRTQKSLPEHTASLKAISTQKPMTAADHARVMQHKAELRRRLEERQDDIAIEQSCYGYERPRWMTR